MKKIAIYTMICGILGFLAVVNIFTAQQVKYLSDITLSIQAQAGDGGSDGSVEVVAMEISGSILKDGWKNLVLFLEEGLFTKMYAEGQSKGGVAVRNMMMDRDRMLNKRCL